MTSRLDLVPNLTVVLIVAGSPGLPRPTPAPRTDGVGQRLAAHVDDQIELRTRPRCRMLLGKWSRRSISFPPWRDGVAAIRAPRGPRRRWRASAHRCHRRARKPPPSGCGRRCRCRRTARASAAGSQLLQEQLVDRGNRRSVPDETWPPGAALLHQHRIAIVPRQHLGIRSRCGG